MKKTAKDAIKAQLIQTQVKPDAAFVTQLRNEIKGRIEQKQKSSFNIIEFLASRKIKLLILLGFFAVTSTLIIAPKITPSQSDNKPQVKAQSGTVYALEQIRNASDQIQNPNFILYEKQINTTYLSDGRSMISTVEKWLDNGGFMQRNIASYTDSPDYTRVLDKNDVEWSYSSDVSTVYKKINLNRDASKLPQDGNLANIESVQYVGKFLKEDKHEVVSEDDQQIVFRIDRSVENIIKSRKVEASYELYYYSKPSYLPTKVEVHFRIGGKDLLIYSYVLELQKLPRTQENLDKYFTFDTKLLDNKKLETTEYDFKSKETVKQ